MFGKCFETHTCIEELNAVNTSGARGVDPDRVSNDQTTLESEKTDGLGVISSAERGTRTPSK